MGAMVDFKYKDKFYFYALLPPDSDGLRRVELYGPDSPGNKILHIYVGTNSAHEDIINSLKQKMDTC